MTAIKTGKLQFEFDTHFYLNKRYVLHTTMYMYNSSERRVHRSITSESRNNTMTHFYVTK